MADGQESQEQKHASIGEKSRQWLLALGTVTAIVATTIGFLSDSVGVWQFLKSYGIVQESAPTPETKVVLAFVATETPVEAATFAPLPTATPVITPTNTPVPVEAAPNERLLIIAQFSNFASDASYNVAGRIEDALTEQVAAANLADTHVAEWPETIGDLASATTVLQETGATLVIWGEYDSGRVRIRFVVAEGGQEVDWQRFLGTPTELSTTINLDVPRETQALALIALGRVYRNSGDMRGARAAFAQALAEQPSDEDTIATLTFYLAILDAGASPPALDTAIAGYTKVIELRPAWFNARYNRGLAYLTRYWETAETTNLDYALDDFTWTLEVKGDYAEAYINRAIAYFARNGKGDVDASVKDLTSALQHNPTSYRAYYNRALAYIRLEQEDGWKADLGTSLDIAPNFWEAYHALCWGYALEMDPQDGLSACEQAVKHDTTGASRDGSALVMAELGRLDEATNDLEQYLGWLDTQPPVSSKLNNRSIYEAILAGLYAGEKRVTRELVNQLR